MDRIQHIKQLGNTYLDKFGIYPPTSNDVTKTFCEWYNELIEFLSQYFSDDNSDFSEIYNANISGEGASLYEVYSSVSKKSAKLFGLIERGNTPTLKNGVNHDKKVNNERNLVFISHASADRDIIREFIDDILKNGIGLDNENIVCTSFECTTALPGTSIPQYIKDNIANASAVLAMVSKAYKKSEVCQNEIGAAWALNNEPISVVLPDCDYRELGWLFNLEKAIKIDTQESLDLLQKTLCKRFPNTHTKKPIDWNPCVKKFLNKLDTINRTKKEEKDVFVPSSSSTDVNNQDALEHDRKMFRNFDGDFSEDTLKYSLSSLNTTTHFNDYELRIWRGIIEWLEKSSNSYLDSNVQQSTQQLLECLNNLVAFTSAQYSPNRRNWNFDDINNVSLEKKREILESRIYSWEPDIFDERLFESKQKKIIDGISVLVPKVEDAYIAFRKSVKRRLCL